jgi:D-alanyl-D-alanine carboxypeptidase (penicillin-binding protein 5/6)
MGVPAAALLAGALSSAASPAALGIASRLPHLSAREALALQPDTGEVIYARHADRRVPIASTTKLMTALLTLERGSLSRRLTVVAYHALPAESTAGLRPGERLTVRDLLRALLLASANEAADTLARRQARSIGAFVALMNRRARALRLTSTHYSNPVGLDERGNYSSAADLLKLTRVLMTDRFFAHTVALRRARLISGARSRTVVNRNTLVQDVSYVRGVKTGHTLAAGYVLVGAARRHGVTVLSAVLGDPSEKARNADSLALLRYGLGRYRRVAVLRHDQVLARVALRFRSGQTVALVPRHAVRVLVRVGQRPQIRLAGIPHELDGPLALGARAGSASVSVGGRVVARVDLVTSRALAAASLGRRLSSYVSRPGTLLLLGGLAGCSLLLVALRRRVARRGAALEHSRTGSRTTA